MKKWISLIISMIFVVAFTACAGQPSSRAKATLSDENVTLLCDTTGTITFDSQNSENIEWSVSDNSVVKLSPNPQDNRYLNITALDPGIAIIEVCQGDVVERCTVKVVALSLMRGEGHKLTLDLKDGYVSKNLAVYTNFPDDKSLSYRSDNLQVAYVQNNGVVVAVGVGVTNVTVSHPSGITYVVTVTVVNTLLSE